MKTSFLQDVDIALMRVVDYEAPPLSHSPPGANLKKRGDLRRPSY